MDWPNILFDNCLWGPARLGHESFSAVLKPFAEDLKIWSAIRDCFGNQKIFCLAIYPFVWQSKYFLACQLLNLACHLARGNTAILHPMIIPWQWFNSLLNGVGLPSKCFMVFWGVCSFSQKLLPRSQKLTEWKIKFSNNSGRLLAKWEYYLPQLHAFWVEVYMLHIHQIFFTLWYHGLLKGIIRK